MVRSESGRGREPGLRALLASLVVLLSLTGPLRAEDNGVAAIFALRVGDYQGAQQYLAEVYRTQPADPFWFGPDGIAPLFLAWGRGDSERVLIEGGKAAARTKDPQLELALRLLVCQAAFGTGQPALAREQLPRLEALAQTDLHRYLVATFGARAAQMAGASVPARPRIGTLRADEKELVELALLPEALAFWQERLLARGELAEARRLYEGEMLPALQAMVPKTEQLEGAALWNALGLYWQVALTTDRMAFEFYRRAPVEPARLTEWMSRHVAELEGQKKALEGKSGLFPCVLHGRLGLALAQAHMALASAYLGDRQPGSFSSEETSRILDQVAAAAVAASTTSDRALVLGIQLEYARALWYARPPGWEVELGKTLDRLKSASTRPQRIAAGAYEGRLRAWQGRKADAITVLSATVDLLEGYILEAGGREFGRQLRTDYREVYELLAQLQLESGQPHLAMEALDRQAQLDTSLRFRPDRLQPRKPGLGARLARAVELQDRSLALETQGPGANRLLAETRQDFYKLLDEIQKAEPGYTRLAVRPNNFSRLQRFVPPGAVVIQIFPSETKTFLFVMTKDALKIREVPVGRAQLESYVDDFRAQIIRYARTRKPFTWEDATGRALLKTMKGLSGALLDPIAADLDGQKLVAFVPTGMLSYFPLQCLLVDDKPTLLIERFQVVHLTKSSDMDAVMLPPNHEFDGLTALADPDGTLEGARAEAGMIASIFAGSKVYLGPEATSARLSALEPGTDFLHLATHGVVDSKKPTESYLVVAGAPPRLTVTEIAGLDLATLRMVTLSACSSALADRDPGLGTDLSSLADAFGFAGSPSLVASLWKVEDTATAELMTGFYQALASNQGRAEAMQTAQIGLLRKPERRHPFFWASFILVGDWR